MTLPQHGPASRVYYSQRLRLHYVDWGNESAPPLMLVHGGRDHCRNWDWMAASLRDKYHVFAPDLRGHGDSQWMVGGHYSMIDYVYDVAQLVHQLEAAPITLVGHSLGGAICLQYAGIYPNKVKKVVSIDGFGPPPDYAKQRAETPVEVRMRGWVKQVRELSGRLPRRYPTLEECVKRMQEANPRLSDEQAKYLTLHGAIQNEDQTFSWKFDNYVRALSPYLFNAEEMHTLWRNIECPVQLIHGMESWSGDPEADGRSSHFKDVKIVHVEKAGHWVHHDQLQVVLDTVRAFLD